MKTSSQPAPRDRLGRSEDALEVDRAVAGRLGRVVDHDLAEVPLGLQRAGGDHPGLQEMREVAEPVQLGEPFHRIGGQRHVVAPGDLQQRPGPDGALQVHVQLDLRKRHGLDYLGGQNFLHATSNDARSSTMTATHWSSDARAPGSTPKSMASISFPR